VTPRCGMNRDRTSRRRLGVPQWPPGDRSSGSSATSQPTIAISSTSLAVATASEVCVCVAVRAHSTTLTSILLDLTTARQRHLSPVRPPSVLPVLHHHFVSSRLAPVFDRRLMTLTLNVRCRATCDVTLYCMTQCNSAQSRS